MLPPLSNVGFASSRPFGPMCIYSSSGFNFYPSFIGPTRSRSARGQGFSSLLPLVFSPTNTPSTGDFRLPTIDTNGNGDAYIHAHSLVLNYVRPGLVDVLKKSIHDGNCLHHSTFPI
jgi:hypothetical protein